MAKESRISILDVTIRDGSYAIDYQYTPDQVGAVAKALDSAGIDFIEVSHGCGLGARENFGMPAAASDAEYVAAAKKAVNNAKIGAIASGSHATYPKDIDAVIEDADFIRFAANCDNPSAVASNIEYARSRKPGLLILVQLMRANRRPVKDIVKAAAAASAMGVDIIYVVDTAGHFLPEEVSEIVSEIISKCDIEVGFHGHDNLGLAIANSLAAVKAGAVSIDASLRGIGRAGGNAQLEALVSLLHRMGLAGDVDIDLLVAAGTRLVAPIMPPRAGIEEIDVLTADANIDLYPVDFYRRISDAAGVSLIDLIRAFGGDREIVEVDIDAIRRVLKSMGKDPDAVFRALGIGGMR